MHCFHARKKILRVYFEFMRLCHIYSSLTTKVQIKMIAYLPKNVHVLVWFALCDAMENIFAYRFYSNSQGTLKRKVTAHLHQASVSLRQCCCDDACDTVLIDHNGVAPKWVATPFSSIYIVVNENCVTSVITAMTQTDSDAWCKRPLTL